MSGPSPQEVTIVLRAAAAGDRHATDQLLPLVYNELRAMARSRLAHTPPGNTLQPTALVHEAYMKLLGADPDNPPNWENRAHFFGAAARAMRNILVDQARRKAGPKAGGGRRREDLDALEDQTPLIQAPIDDMVALDQALSELDKLDARKAQVVMFKYFAGLEHEHIAQALGVSIPTIERDWAFARSWLQAKLKGRGDTL